MITTQLKTKASKKLTENIEGDFMKADGNLQEILDENSEKHDRRGSDKSYTESSEENSK